MSQIANGGNDLAGPDVQRCVLDSFKMLAFPAPESVVVVVVVVFYPLIFTPR